jgi:hypothetical protein
MPKNGYLHYLSRIPAEMLCRFNKNPIEIPLIQNYCIRGILLFVFSI